MSFHVGDGVHWISQSFGYDRLKEGVVVAVVPAGAHPAAHLDPASQFCLPRDLGKPRNHESYLVHVKNLSRLYWPRVSLLRLDVASTVEKAVAAEVKAAVDNTEALKAISSQVVTLVSRSKMIEAVAERIYEAMRFDRVMTIPAWVDSGNSEVPWVARKAAEVARKAAEQVVGFASQPASKFLSVEVDALERIIERMSGVEDVHHLAYYRDLLAVGVVRDMITQAKEGKR